MMDLQYRLAALGVGGCTCMTKTHEIEYHKPYCQYRVVSEARLELERLYRIEDRYMDLKAIIEMEAEGNGIQ